MASKDSILADAKTLDMKRAEYKKDQQMMLTDVSVKTIELKQNTVKRRAEEERLLVEQRTIDSKEIEILKRAKVLDEKQLALRQKEIELEQHRIFSQFLDQVVEDTSGDKEAFADVGDLHNRFKSLKNENTGLLERKRQLEGELNETKDRERNQIQELKNVLHNEQKRMQDIQAELEGINEAAGVLEGDFEKEIARRNQKAVEVSLIVTSVNNIYNIAQVQHEKRGRKALRDEAKVHEESKNLVASLLTRLERAHQTVDDLVKVYQEFGGDGEKEKVRVDRSESAPLHRPGPKKSKEEDKAASKPPKRDRGSKMSI